MQTPIYTEKEKKMMGQQQIMAEKEAGGALRRIALALAVAAVMARTARKPKTP
jgi:hypothetical protein